MSRNIDADKLKKHYAWWRETENGRKMADIFDEIVDAQPPAEVPDRKIGKWVSSRPDAPMFGFHYCQFCGRKRTSPQDHFCPNCGAKLEGTP